MNQKFLDLNGLTTYDKKIKDWIKSSIVDIAEDTIRELFVAAAEGPADNEIWYISKDGNVVTPQDRFGVIIVSNEYNNGKGVITFSGPVTSIASYAFSSRSSLTSITIPNSVTSIGGYAFNYCSYLPSITIPNSVTNIALYAFRGCSSLTSITFEGTIEQWNSITKGADWNEKVPATHVQCSDGQVAL